jgi:hypothetical protein
MSEPLPNIGKHISDFSRDLISLEYLVRKYGHIDCLKKILEEVNDCCPFCKTKTEHDLLVESWRKVGKTPPCHGFPDGKDLIYYD